MLGIAYQNSLAQFGYVRLVPSNDVFVSQGITKSVSTITGTLGMHYFMTDYYGTSLQTDFVRDFGWYNDLRFYDEDVIVICSIGHSIVHNSISYSLRIGIRWRTYW